ncbi:MAG: HvfA family oxazolone/thioamide-modified RiPP metallophore [Dokdonella sp.]|uniref:HvfA family oxazolone/thioamide-modified RiPP metallophore n=1 Tax=Dokdonella sp. TaxID=2291710 RepID=UPI003F810598
MSSKIGNTLGVAIGAAFIGSLSLSQLAAASPAFQASDLATGYMLAAAGEGKCGEGKCGIEKMDSNKDGKVSMDEMKAMKTAHLEEHFKEADTNGDGFIDKAEMDAHHAAMKKKGHEGSCGGDKKKAEGSCGGKKAEGSCGGDKKKSAEGSCGGHKDAEGSCGGAR